MNIITVIPLSRTKVTEELMYFTSIDVTIGAIVTVPLRKKNIYAIITKIEPVQDLKTEIKNAPFEIRKLNSLKASNFFPHSFINASKELADFYAYKTGTVIDTMVSNLILENIDKIAPPLPLQASLDIPDKNKEGKIKNRVFAVQGDDQDRISSWRSLIRQEFAGKRSIAIYTPTIDDCQRIFSAIEKGIEGYIFLLNGEMTSKKFISTWKAINEIDHPIVIIATGSFSLLPRSDIKTIIIERENSRGWISPKIPYIDIRHALLIIAKANKQNVYLADSMLRLETQKAVEDEILEEGSPFKWRSISLAKDILIDMRQLKKVEQNEQSFPEKGLENEREVKFKILSNELKDLIKTNIEESAHLFIFATRKGLAPLTVCDDCGSVVMCNQCKATVVLHKSEETDRNFFMCHNCGERRSAEENCAICGSWKLTPLGLGIDRIKEEIKKEFPDLNLLKIDSDSTKNEKEIKEVLEKFRSKPGSILIGTEMFMQNYGEKIEHIAIASLDSLFSLPDFRIQEKIMYTLVRLRAQATKTILVQTRKAEQKVFEYGLKGNLSDFYRTTIDEREQFNYPPYSTLIKITIEGKRDDIANSMAEITKLLEPHEVDIFPAFTSTVRGKSVIHGLIKIDINAWPDNDLISKLRSLPPNVIIKVNPETLL